MSDTNIFENGNYPPGFLPYPSRAEEVEQNCKNGHIWFALIYNELGGGFYIDEDMGPVCPECGELDINY